MKILERLKDLLRRPQPSAATITLIDGSDIPGTGDPYLDGLVVQSLNAERARFTGGMPVPDWIRNLDFLNAEPERLSAALDELDWIVASEYPETQAGTFDAMDLRHRIRVAVAERGLEITYGAGGRLTVHGGEIPPTIIRDIGP